METIDLLSDDPVLIHGLAEQNWGQMDAALRPLRTADEALALWANAPPRLILWDMRLPGSAALAAFWRAHPAAPGLFLLGALPADLSFPLVFERALLPLRIGQLLARLQLRLRLGSRVADEPVTLGPWLFSPADKELQNKNEGEAVKLTDKETELLAFLAKAPAPVSREALLAEVWGYEGALDTHTLETHLTRLRRKGGLDFFQIEDGFYAIDPALRAL